MNEDRVLLAITIRQTAVDVVLSDRIARPAAEVLEGRNWDLEEQTDHDPADERAKGGHEEGALRR